MNYIFRKDKYWRMPKSPQTRVKLRRPFNNFMSMSPIRTETQNMEYNHKWKTPRLNYFDKRS